MIQKITIYYMKISNMKKINLRYYIFKPGALAEAHARFLEIAFIREICVHPRGHK